MRLTHRKREVRVVGQFELRRPATTAENSQTDPLPRCDMIPPFVYQSIRKT